MIYFTNKLNSQQFCAYSIKPKDKPSFACMINFNRVLRNTSENNKTILTRPCFYNLEHNMLYKKSVNNINSQQYITVFT